MPRTALKRRHNLPAHRLRLIGRERDLLVVRQALLGAEGRLLTLTGTGGCGKTRLVLELAPDVVSHFPNGVWLVELAAVADPTLVPQAIVSALGIRERAGEPLSATLIRVLSRGELLLVLDNCEHVIEVCARLVEELLDHCPRLRVLATSREPLRIAGEVTWRVPSLALPEPGAGPDDLLRSPAVQLFVERAQAAVPDFAASAHTAAIAGICSRLDGLPLAIELAAARVRTLGVAQILERLDDSVQLLVGGSRTAASRHQTLRATLDWSYGLLSDDERTVFGSLSVIAESCNLDAAEAICIEGDVGQSSVLDLLQGLVDKSMVVVYERNGEARYRLLEPVKQYAEARLIASGERDAVRRRHALYYVAFGEARESEATRGPRRFVAVRELGGEYPNIRAALSWSVETRETQLGLGLAGSLNFLWQIYGSASEGLAWVRQLLALEGADEPTEARARVLITAARMSELRGDFEAAQAFCQEASPLARLLAQPSLEWLVLQFSLLNAIGIGDAVSAERYAHAALACARAAADPLNEGMTVMGLARIACDQADYARAQPFAEEALRLARVGKDAWNEGWALAQVGHVALGQGALQKAKAALDAGLDLARQQAEPPSLTSFVLDALGELGTASGQPDEARDWLLRSLEVRYEGGERNGIADTLDRLAALAASCAQAERALQLAGAADAVYTELGAGRFPAEQQKLERWLLRLRATFGEQAADDLMSHGRALGLEDAIALARGGDQKDTRRTGGALLEVSASILTAREREVAARLTRGLTNRQIAEQLVITERTVAAHVEHILNKLGFASRHQVGAWATEHGLLN
jgi:predicted ATPase/DNA-binding CsgD family transcriptional regulator